MRSIPSGAPCVTVALFVLSLTGCGGSTGDGGKAAVTDSAGVQLVSNSTRGLWGDHSPWRFEEELRIGGMGLGAGESSEAVFGAVIGLDLDGDGNVYVADQQAQHVQVFGPDGRFVRTIGSPGSGPGEISRAMAGVFVRTEQVWVPDVSNQRIDLYKLDGTPDGSLPIDLSHGVPVHWAHASAERIVAQIRTLGLPGMVDNPTGDPVVTFGSEAQDTITVLPKGGTLTFSGGQPRIRVFEPEPLWDATPDGRLVTAMNAAYRVEVHDSAGALVRVITKPFTPREVTEADQKQLLDVMRKMLVAQGTPPQAVDQVMGLVGFADKYPAMSRVLAGPDGTIWVQRVRTAEDVSDGSETFNPDDMGSDDWDVFDAAGQYLGVLTVPLKFSPLLVREDALWGVQRDSLDVPSVVHYRLVSE